MPTVLLALLMLTGLHYGPPEAHQRLTKLSAEPACASQAGAERGSAHVRPGMLVAQDLLRDDDARDGAARHACEREAVAAHLLAGACILSWGIAVRPLEHYIDWKEFCAPATCAAMCSHAPITFLRHAHRRERHRAQQAAAARTGAPAARTLPRVASHAVVGAVALQVVGGVLPVQANAVPRLVHL